MTAGFLPEILNGAGRRTIAEADIVDLLRLCGWALDPAAGAAGAVAALEALIAAGVPHDARRFDPAEVINFVKLRRADAGPFWRDRYVATGRALVAESSGSGTAGPPDLSALPPRRFDLLIRRRFSLHDVAPATRLRLRLPVPIPDARLRLLAVTPIAPARAECRVAAGRLEARMQRPQAEDVTIAARLSFVVDPSAPDHALPMPDWLAPASRARADRVAGHIRDPLTAVLALYDHLLDGLAYGVMPYDRLPSTDAQAPILAAGWCDCRLGASLLVALARARGLPARLVGGYLLWRAPTEHYWAEVHVAERGWLPFDLGGWDLSNAGVDRPWRRLLAGAADYRMTTQLFPRMFTGPPGISFPPAWHRLMRAIPGGTETRFVAIPDGRVILAEEVLFEAEPSEPEGGAVRPLDPGSF